MGQVWNLVEQHMADTPYGVSARQIAQSAGVKPSTFAAWKNLRRLPDPEHLRAVARQINVPYRVLLDAALVDTGYLEGRGGSNAAPINPAGGSPADELSAKRRQESIDRAVKDAARKATVDPGDED